MSIKSRIEKLRNAMHSQGVKAVIIPSNDAHQSEYVPEYWKGREWISGFTGSAGTVVITTDSAGLWTDGRYYIQGEEELRGTDIVLHKMDKKPGPQYLRWLRDNLSAGDKVAIDGNICSLSVKNTAIKYLEPEGIELVTDRDLLEDAWDDRPAFPKEPIFVHDTAYSGEDRTSRLRKIQSEIKDQKADYYLVTTLDDIAWTLNLRGSDVECNPVFLSYMVVGPEHTTLYVDDSRIPADVKTELDADGIKLAPYSGIIADLNNLPDDKSILIDPSNCSVALHRAINCHIIQGKTIPRRLKAIKNETELNHVRHLMEKDAVALAHTFYWLEQEMKAGHKVKETTVAEKLAHYRGQQDHYIGESFAAIVGYKGNGAIIHYRAMPDTCAEIQADGILLCDSGGQYLDGTTDITRTLAMGTPSAEEKRCFTLVLKGMISLTEARFPEGTTGGQLDILARQFLWNQGLNYGHGTGHGVGFFMNVHEPPQGFAPPPSERASTRHEVGMISSNEPGFYKENAFGIRIENLVVCKKDKHEGFLSHETLTLYPIDIRMIDERLMTSKEKAWLNNYHHMVWERVSPHLEGELKDWFELKCRGMN